MTVDIDNIRVSYFLSGNENSEEAVVMLHGWGAKKELFASAAAPISQKYIVAAPDMPGFGKTPEPESEWTVDCYADLVIKFIEKLGLKRVILLGHSFGGRVIIKVASREKLPFEATKIILVDSAGIKPVKSAEQKFKENLGKAGKRLLSSAPGLLEKLRSKTGSADYRAASPLMRRILVNVVNEDLTPLLPLIRQPVLLIWGTLDTATPLSDAKKMESLIPEAGLAEIAGAGHFSFLDNPALFNAIIASFLKL